jgi:hypothetical protein
MTDEEHSAYLEALTDQIAVASRQLDQSQQLYERESSEFREIYEKAKTLFDTCKGSWKESPDEKSTVSLTNIFWVFQVLEKTITGLMNDVFERASLQIEASGGLDVKPPVELEHPVSKVRGHARDQEIILKQGELTRPLTIEEVRRLL